MTHPRHGRQAFILSLLLGLSALALALWPRHPALAALPIALKAVVHGGLAVRDHRRRKAAIARFFRGVPVGRRPASTQPSPENP